MTDDLSHFFNLLAQEKKHKKEEVDSIIGDIQLDSLFEEVSALKRKNKETKEKEKKLTNAFESFLYSEKPKKSKNKLKPIVPEYPENVDVKPKDEEVLESKETIVEKSLGLLSEPSEIKQQKDLITPLNQNFVTLEDLNKHYNLFLNRIQQQLSTLGGGGETNLAYMDMPLTYVTSSSYTIKTQDYYIGVNYAGRVNITLPTPRKNGKVYIVKDERGEASRGNNRHIYIYPSGSDLIDGEEYVVIAYDFGSLTFVYRNGWRVV